ncbi:hypothetical protein MRX96_010305 [Rhipicephalus microplus]
MPPGASFQTYVRTQGAVQTVIHQDDLQRKTRGGRWTLVLSVVVLACSLVATLTALIAMYCAHVHKKKTKKRRKRLDKDGKSDASSSSREDVDSVRNTDHKEYLAATDVC